MKGILLIISMLALGGLVYAHDPQTGFNETDPAYRTGYIEGYAHGTADQRAGATFDYEHDPSFQDADRHTTAHHESLAFRLGYVEGYADGYFRKIARIRDDIGHDDDYGDGVGFGPVVAYTQSGFRGSVREFDLGRYPELEDTLNDDIESLRVDGNVRVILFDQSNFRGPSIVVTRDAPDLGYFRDRAASMIVEPLRYSRY